MKLVLPAICAFIALTPLRAEAHNWKFCFNWKMQQEDGNVGEDNHATTTSMRARGVAFAIMHDNWSLPHMTHANESEGCFSFTANETSGFEVTMWAESSIGDDIIIRAFPQVSDQSATDLHGGTRTWVFLVNPNTSGGTVNITPATFDPIQNLIAWGSFIVWWIDSNSGTRIDGPTNLNLNNHDEGIPGSSHQSLQDVFINPTHATDIDADVAAETVNGSRMKFLIGHEVGHWFLNHAWDNGAADSFHQYNFNSPAPTAACAFSAGLGGGHALFSQEWNASAFFEGFPHFLSALAFNTHSETNGFFRYYKYVPAYTTLQSAEWIVDVENSGTPAGGFAHANCKVNGVLTPGTGTEVDWLRHYWDFRTNAATSPEVKPTHGQLFMTLVNTQFWTPWVGHDVYDKLVAGLGLFDIGLTATQQAALVDRWETLGAINGIDQ